MSHSPSTRPAEGAPAQSPSSSSSRAAARWGRGLGVLAFMFFLTKGLAWLIVPAAIAVFASR